MAIQDSESIDWKLICTNFMKGNLCGSWQRGEGREKTYYSCNYELGMYLWDLAMPQDETSEMTVLKRTGPLEYEGFRIVHGAFDWYHEVRVTVDANGYDVILEWPAVLASVCVTLSRLQQQEQHSR